MIDKRKIIEALEAHQGQYKGLSASVVAGCIQVIRDLPEEDGWIPVTERLPEEYEEETDLMSFRHYKASDLVIVAVMNSDRKRFVSDDVAVNGKWVNYPPQKFDVTHWMPMPKPPEEEK